MLFSVQELHIYTHERIRLHYTAGDMLFVLVSGWIEHPHLFEGEGGDRVWCRAIFKCVGALKSAETSRCLVM
jgi:hypothetical protein